MTANRCKYASPAFSPFDFVRSRESRAEHDGAALTAIIFYVGDFLRPDLRRQSPFNVTEDLFPADSGVETSMSSTDEWRKSSFTTSRLPITENGVRLTSAKLATNIASFGSDITELDRHRLIRLSWRIRSGSDDQPSHIKASCRFSLGLFFWFEVFIFRVTSSDSIEVYIPVGISSMSLIEDVSLE